MICDDDVRAWYGVQPLAARPLVTWRLIYLGQHPASSWPSTAFPAKLIPRTTVD